MNVSRLPNFGFNRHSKDHHEKLKYVLTQQGPKRWRAASDFYLYINPVVIVRDPETDMPLFPLDAKQARQRVIAEVTAERKKLELAGNQMARSSDKNSSNRWALRMPPGELQFIELIDPDFLAGTGYERKKSLRAAAKAFPEYAIYTRI